MGSVGKRIPYRGNSNDSSDEVSEGFSLISVGVDVGAGEGTSSHHHGQEFPDQPPGLEQEHVPEYPRVRAAKRKRALAIKKRRMGFYYQKKVALKLKRDKVSRAAMKIFGKKRDQSVQTEDGGVVERLSVRTRVPFTEDQKKVMIAEFQKENKPSSTKIEQIAKDIKATEASVKDWYCHRRYQMKLVEKSKAE